MLGAAAGGAGGAVLDCSAPRHNIDTTQLARPPQHHHNTTTPPQHRNPLYTTQPQNNPTNQHNSHPHSRIAAHVVYNEYIQDKHHVHMNSTQWLTLTDFVKHLGREGICKVEETPKGWFITLVHVSGWGGRGRGASLLAWAGLARARQGRRRGVGAGSGRGGP